MIFDALSGVSHFDYSKEKCVVMDNGEEYTISEYLDLSDGGEEARQRLFDDSRSGQGSLPFEDRKRALRQQPIDGTGIKGFGIF